MPIVFSASLCQNVLNSTCFSDLVVATFLMDIILLLFYSSGSLEATYITETLMEHVAYRLGKDPTDVKKLNLYKAGEVISAFIN